MTKTLYTIGYQGIKGPDVLLSSAKRLGAIVADIRFSPRSRAPFWSQRGLTIMLRERYVHIAELGNRNYKGGPIEIVDIEAGTKRIAALIKSQSVILMCACWNLQTCHRRIVAEQIAARLGCEVVHLQKSDLAELPKNNEEQPPLL